MNKMSELTQNEINWQLAEEYIEDSDREIEGLKGEIEHLEQLIVALILQQSGDGEVLISEANWQAAAVIGKMVGYYVEDGENGGKLVGVVPF